MDMEARQVRQAVSWLSSVITLPSTGRGVTILHLPPEIIVSILRYFNPAELCTIATVCRAFYNAASDDSLWRPFCTPKWNLSAGWKPAYHDWVQKAASACARSSIGGYAYYFKVAVVGMQACGKKHMMRRLVEGVFNQARASVFHPAITIHEERIKLLAAIFDQAVVNPIISPGTLTGFEGAMICYSVTSQSSWDLLPRLLPQVERTFPTAARLLIGLKSDSPDRVISVETAQAFAEEHNLPFLEVSAKMGHNVVEAFSLLIALMQERLFEPVAGPTPAYIPPLGQVWKRVSKNL